MTPEQAISRIKAHMEIHKLKEPQAVYTTEALNMAICALKEIQQYREIGTMEECRESREKQKPKRPIWKPYEPDDDFGDLTCPLCGEFLTDRIPFDRKDFYFHCLNCGQKFDWSENLEGMEDE